MSSFEEEFKSLQTSCRNQQTMTKEEMLLSQTKSKQCISKKARKKVNAKAVLLNQQALKDKTLEQLRSLRVARIEWFKN